MMYDVRLGVEDAAGREYICCRGDMFTMVVNGSRAT